MCKVRRKLCETSLKNPSKIDLKSPLNRSRKPSKTTLKKTSPKKHQKVRKSLQNRLPKGGPKGDLECGFRTCRGLWAPLGANMAPRPPPGAPPTLRTLIFDGFGSHFGSILAPFGDGGRQINQDAPPQERLENRSF